MHHHENGWNAGTHSPLYSKRPILHESKSMVSRPKFQDELPAAQWACGWLLILVLSPAINGHGIPLKAKYSYSLSSVQNQSINNCYQVKIKVAGINCCRSAATEQGTEANWYSTALYPFLQIVINPRQDCV